MSSSTSNTKGLIFGNSLDNLYLNGLIGNHTTNTTPFTFTGTTTATSYMANTLTNLQ